MPLLLLLIVLLFSSPSSSYAIEQTSSVKVSASVGVNEVTITGYTSPNSWVELTSINVYEKTYSQEDGYFEFNHTLLPKNYTELCLISKDHSGRSTTPICIPDPPHSNYYTEIGPVILPPTLTLDNPNIKPGSTVITSGQSIPNTPVNIYFYKVNDSAKPFQSLNQALLKLRPKSAYAYSLPVLTTKADDKGNFNLNLPTVYSSNFRFYASANYNDNPSPKSNTLLYYMPIQTNIIYIVFLPASIAFLILIFYLLHLKFSPKPIRFLPAIYKFLPANPKKFYPALYPETLLRSHNIPA